MKKNHKPTPNTDQVCGNIRSFYLNYLKKEGFSPKIDLDGDVSFKKEGMAYYIDIEQQCNDPHYILIILPSVLHFTDKDKFERVEILEIVNLVTAKMKGIKATLSENNMVSFRFECLISNQQEFYKFFPRAMGAFNAAQVLTQKILIERTIGCGLKSKTANGFSK